MVFDSATVGELIGLTLEVALLAGAFAVHRITVRRRDARRARRFTGRAL